MNWTSFKKYTQKTSHPFKVKWPQHIPSDLKIPSNYVLKMQKGKKLYELFQNGTFLLDFDYKKNRPRMYS